MSSLCKQCKRPLVKQHLSPDKMPVPLTCVGDTSVFTFGKHEGQPFSEVHTNYIKTVLRTACHSVALGRDDCCALHRYMARERSHVQLDFNCMPCKCYGYGGAKIWSCPVHGYL